MHIRYRENVVFLNVSESRVRVPQVVSSVLDQQNRNHFCLKTYGVRTHEAIQTLIPRIPRVLKKRSKPEPEIAAKTTILTFAPFCLFFIQVPSLRFCIECPIVFLPGTYEYGQRQNG